MLLSCALEAHPGSSGVMRGLALKRGTSVVLQNCCAFQHAPGRNRGGIQFVKKQSWCVTRGLFQNFDVCPEGDILALHKAKVLLRTPSFWRAFPSLGGFLISRKQGFFSEPPIIRLDFPRGVSDFQKETILFRVPNYLFAYPRGVSDSQKTRLLSESPMICWRFPRGGLGCHGSKTAFQCPQLFQYVSFLGVVSDVQRAEILLWYLKRSP